MSDCQLVSLHLGSATLIAMDDRGEGTPGGAAVTTTAAMWGQSSQD